jgi:hypothetical protein
VGWDQGRPILGRSLLNEVQNHVRPNFATPMLYTKNHSKFHNFFCRAIKPLELYFVNEIYIIIFVIISIVVVQNGGFCKKRGCQILLPYFGMQQTHFEFFTWKKFDNYLTKD